MAKYRLYVDEVGNPSLKRPHIPENRFLSLTGVIADLDYVQSNIYPDMESLKVKYFGSHPDEPVVLHRIDMVAANEPFQSLADPGTRTAFDADLIALLRHWDYHVVTVCLDKTAMSANVSDAYGHCFTLLLEGFNAFLEHSGFPGDVMVESRGAKEDQSLKGLFRHLTENGTDNVARDRLQRSLTSRELKVRPRIANVSGLQIADLIAHPSRDEILDEQGLLGRPLGTYANLVIQELAEKYIRFGEFTRGKHYI